MDTEVTGGDDRVTQRDRRRRSAEAALETLSDAERVIREQLAALRHDAGDGDRHADELAELQKQLTYAQGRLNLREAQIRQVRATWLFRALGAVWLAQRHPKRALVVVPVVAVAAIVAAGLALGPGVVIGGVVLSIVVMAAVLIVAFAADVVSGRQAARAASVIAASPAHAGAGVPSGPPVPSGSTAADPSALPTSRSGLVPAVEPLPGTPDVSGGARRLILTPPPGPSDADRARWLTGLEPVDPREVRVAAILDEMSHACFAPECELITFGMSDWQTVLERERPHLLLVESAWSGNGGRWQYGVASYTHPDYLGLPALNALIDWCRTNDVPTVFWNKEDPVHFERFKEAAGLFDHIFTTDALRIPAYRALGSERTQTVDALPFAAQPTLHNPISAAGGRLREPVFAGTYYRDRHADRRVAMEMLLDAARPYGLVIYDRTFGAAGAQYGFPERFLPHVRGRLPYAEMVEVYKRHELFLNVNSVTESPTMFSRRVFELLASGTAVVSTGSRGIEEMFGDLVPTVEDEGRATSILRDLLTEPGACADLAARGRRLVHRHHTYRERFETILRTAGFDVGPRRDDAVSVLLLPGTDVSARRQELREQTHQPSAVITADAASAADGTVGLVDFDPVMGPVGWLKRAAAQATSPWVLFVDGSEPMPPNLIEDRLSCIRYAAADVVGSAEGADAPCFATSVTLPGALMKRDIAAGERWRATDDGRSIDAGAFATGVRVFAGDART